MCRGCYDAYGLPAINTERTREAARLIGRIYEFHLAGGNAHIVVDDWNLEDDSIDWCLDESRDSFTPASEEQLRAERECLQALKRLSLEERASAMAIHCGML